jgi:hypothetical protein
VSKGDTVFDKLYIDEQYRLQKKAFLKYIDSMHQNQGKGFIQQAILRDESPNKIPAEEADSP